MPRLFVYGSLKQGFANERFNAGTRLPGRYRTRDRLPMYLLGDGHVPCIVHTPGTGHQVVGEVYDVDDQGLQRMDQLERLGEPGGYQRVLLDVERTDISAAAPVSAFVYVKPAAHVPEATPRIGPLVEYTAEHARQFRW